MISRKMVAGVLVLVALGTALYFLAEKKEEARVCFDGRCFGVEVAANKEDRARGLMFREHLDADRGMLFVFQDEGVYGFWMKNTLIPLDMIWMDKDKKVVYIQEHAEPCRTVQCPSYNPGTKAMYVLELSGGAANESGISVGDTAAF